MTVQTGAVDAAEVLAECTSLTRLAVALVGRRAEAEDLVQTVIANVLPRWSSIQTPRGPYLRRALINAHNDSLRALQRAKRAHERTPSEYPNVDDLELDAVARATVADALDRLSPAVRQVVVLRFYADLSFAEIANLLARPSGTVRRQCSEGLRTLALDDTIATMNGDDRATNDR